MFRGLWADFMWHSYRIIFKSLATDLPLRSPCISGAFPPFPSTTRLHPATGDDGRDSTPFPSRLSEFCDGGDVRWPSLEHKWRHRLPNQSAVKRRYSLDKECLQFARFRKWEPSAGESKIRCWRRPEREHFETDGFTHTIAACLESIRKSSIEIILIAII